MATKLDALTGLRFIAAAMILVHHSREFHIPIPHLAWGNGVSLFFVLSGFILAYVYPSLPDWRARGKFLALRVTRIWPAHIAALLLLLILLRPEIDEKIVANVLMLHGWVPMSPWYFSYNGPSWSISTEFFFYLAFPFLIFAWAKTFWWKWLGAAGLIVGLCVLITTFGIHRGYSPKDIVTGHGLLYINPLARLLEFVSGMVAYSCFAWISPEVARLKASYPRIVFLAGTLVEIAAILVVWHFLTASPVYMLIARMIGLGVWQEWAAHASSFPAFALLIFTLALGLGVVSRALSFWPAVFLGEISYSVYLLHQVVFRAYHQMRPTSAEADYLGLAICLIVTLILAAIVWRWIEVPTRTAVKVRFARHAVIGPSETARVPA